MTILNKFDKRHNLGKRKIIYYCVVLEKNNMYSLYYKILSKL